MPAIQSPTNRPSRAQTAFRRGSLALVAGATATALPFAAAVPASAAAGASSTTVSPAARPDVAARGADWMARQILANGGYLIAYGQPDPGDTAYAVVGLEAVGGHQDAVDAALRYLPTQLKTLKSADGTDNPGALAYFILAGVSAHVDVTHFGGSKPVNDLPARLLRTVRVTGPDAGLVGTSDPTYDGAYREGVALTALSAAGVPASATRTSLALRWLKRQQCTNGLWTSYRADPSVACAPADPATFSGPDTNSTGMAAQGLRAYGSTPRAAAVLDSLSAAQSPDGGFAYLAAPGQASDPDSTALAIQTILAEGGRPGASRWSKGGATPYTALATFQLGRSDPKADRGAFFYPGSRTPNILATVQAVPAAAGRTLPVTG